LALIGRFAWWRASYQQVMEITTNYFSAFSDAEKQRFYGGNASAIL
jgi:hypothetical protein